MFAKFPSAALFGIEAFRVDVEVDIAGGLPGYAVVGLPNTAVREGATRIRSALANCGQTLPARKVTVNLAPADRRKEGAAFDLPIALGVVAGAGVFLPDVLQDLLIVGELGLDGAVRPIRGALAAAALARREGLRGVIVPAACAAEAAAVPELAIHAVGHLSEVLAAMEGAAPLPRYAGSPPAALAPASEGDLREVRGQALARRAVEIAVGGGHNVLLFGPPGIGKTMIAQRVRTILPPMTHDEQIEVTAIYSAAGLSPPEGLVTRRPFRAPHHTVSTGALIGGGAVPRPGEISLAHRGVLFLDELAEFQRPSLEALRQPLEDRAVAIARVGGNVRLPASFHLVASSNPCPCGWHGSDERTCTCSIGSLDRYRARLSGPILDRIDIQVRVGGVSLEELRGDRGGESSDVVRARVEAARDRQAHRLAPFGVRLNAELGPEATRIACRVTADGERTLARLFARRAPMSARGLDRMLRTARTIADLDGRDDVGGDEIREAAMYRALDLPPAADPRALRAGVTTPDHSPALSGGPGSPPAK